LNKEPCCGTIGAGARSDADSGDGKVESCSTWKLDCFDFDFVFRFLDSVRFVVLVVMGWKAGSCVFHLNKDPRRTSAGAGARSGAGAGTGTGGDE